MPFLSFIASQAVPALTVVAFACVAVWVWHKGREQIHPHIEALNALREMGLSQQ